MHTANSMEEEAKPAFSLENLLALQQKVDSQNRVIEEWQREYHKRQYIQRKQEYKKWEHEFWLPLLRKQKMHNLHPFTFMLWFITFSYITLKVYQWLEAQYESHQKKESSH